jgi:2-polyprenyl-6-methoxyphenol hydroxylase-like FAD-dependent oxidoreductase
MTEGPVIIVGGSLNGLTMAVLLADLDVPCVVTERHQNTSIQYKFAGISPRSMEIFRGVGLEDEIRAHKTGDQQGGGIARGKTLADPQIEIMRPTGWPDASPFSPTQPSTCDQNVLEPLLRRRAESLGADVRFGTELVALEQDDRGVRARIRSEAGREETITGAYLVAADGASGRTRERLGIDRTGPGVLQHWMNIIFDTDLPPTLNGQRFTSCFVTALNATFTPREGGRWLLALQYDPERGERPEDFDAARCRELVATGAGRPDVRAELVDARPWEAAATVAQSFRRDRCFLIGDAAHLLPPTGAFGGNSGIHDAHNLAWKLAYVLRGEADEKLLDTYDEERHPVIDATLDQALARLRQWFRDLGGKLPPTGQIVPDYDVVFGQRYRSGAVLAEENGGAGARDASDNAPFADHKTLSGLPGTRAPHCLVEHDGKMRSTLDLFGRGYVLLCAHESRWSDVARAVCAHGLDLKCVPLESRSHHGAWQERFGIELLGAVLVRPDGFVAWRSPRSPSPHDPAAALTDTLRRLYLRSRS